MKPPIIAASLRRKLANLYLTHDRLRANIKALEEDATILQAQIAALEAELKESLS